MITKRISKTINYIKLIQNRINKYLLIQINFPNERDIFRLKIDNLTAENLKQLFKIRPFKSIYTDYSYSFHSGTKEPGKVDKYFVFVRIISGRKKSKYKMPCSKIFLQNNLWIEEVSDFEEYYKHLEKVRV